MSIPLPLTGSELVDACEAALVAGFPVAVRRSPERGPRLRVQVANWTAASLLTGVMEEDPVGQASEVILGRAEVTLDSRGYDRRKVRSWLEDIRARAAAHADFGAKA